MRDKIKSAIGIFFRGATSSVQGAFGAALTLLSFYLLFGLFSGDASIQNYISHQRALRTADAKTRHLADELETTERHIELIQRHSPDFISEMAAKHLNLGDPEVMMIKK